jgi:hypothetical protein
MPDFIIKNTMVNERRWRRQWTVEPSLLVQHHEQRPGIDSVSFFKKSVGSIKLELDVFTTISITY